MMRSLTEEPDKDSQYGYKYPVDLACDLAKNVRVLRYDDTYYKEEGCVIPPLTHEPVAAGIIFTVCELKAEVHHAEHECAHEDCSNGPVPDQPVKDKEYEVEDSDLDYIPHVVIKKRPS